MPNFFSPIGDLFKKMGGAINPAKLAPVAPDKIANGAGNIPLAKAAEGLSVTPKPLIDAPEILNNGKLYANPMERIAEASRAPVTAELPQQEAIPRLAGRDVRSEMALRANDPNPDVRFDTPMQKARFDYVTRDGDPRETHRGFKAGVKDFLTGGAMGVRNADPRTGVAGMLGAFLGGGAGGAVAGKTDAAGFEEQKFDMFRAPQMYEDQKRTNDQRRVEAEVNYRNAQAQRERVSQSIDVQNAALAKAEAERKAAEPFSVSAGQTLLDRRTRQPIYTAPRNETPHWVRNEQGEYVDLNKAQTPVRGYDKPENVSVNDLAKISELEVDANYDPSGERANWMGGVRPEVYRRLKVTPEMEALAANPQKNEWGELTDESKEAVQAVRAAEGQLEQEYQKYEAHKRRQLGAQATLKRLSQKNKGGGQKKTAVNLYQYDGSRYGFQD